MVNMGGGGGLGGGGGHYIKYALDELLRPFEI